MSDSHKCESNRRQLPSTPSCQCHALLSYELRPQPVFRPEAPEESLKELVDDIFRMGTAYLIRSGERVPPAEMAYFECLNEISVSECAASPNLERDQLLGPLAGALDGHARSKSSRSWTSIEDVINFNATHELQTEALGSAEPQKSESDVITKLAPEYIGDSRTAKKNICATVRKPSGLVVRYITEDQLSTMGWKDLFKLARARKVVHGPMMRSKRELVRKFVEKFGVEIPVYETDRLPEEFPSKNSTARWVCGHHGRSGSCAPEQ